MHRKSTVPVVHTVRTAGGSFFLYMANKPHRTFIEQIELLKNRGMKISDEDTAKLWLQRVSYYRLKGYWWAMQDDQVAHHFPENIWDFKDVIYRYRFDEELRTIIFRAIELIEVALRTKIIYYMSKDYGGLWYLNPNFSNDANLHRKHLLHLQNAFVDSKEIFVQEYLTRHPNQLQPHHGYQSDQDPDAWIIFETATFGTLSRIYKNIEHQLPAKSKIANEFGLDFHSDLSSWLESMTYLRNLVAHHSRLWCRPMAIQPGVTSNTRNPWLITPLNMQEQMRAYHLISVLLYLCDAIGEGQSLRTEIYRLIAKYHRLPLHQIGFTQNWNMQPIWKLKWSHKIWYYCQKCVSSIFQKSK